MMEKHEIKKLKNEFIFWKKTKNLFVFVKVETDPTLQLSRPKIVQPILGIGFTCNQSEVVLWSEWAAFPFFLVGEGCGWGFKL